MRNGVSWHDVCILNLSVHGIGIQTAEAPARGTYVEICRGSHAIVARVVWTKGHRAGLRLQDAILIQAIVNDNATAAPSPRVVAGRGVERRRVSRTAQQRHDRSRLVGRTIEFACLSLFAGALAVTGFAAVEQVLAQPLSRISAVLSPE